MLSIQGWISERVRIFRSSMFTIGPYWEWCILAFRTDRGPENPHAEPDASGNDSTGARDSARDHDTPALRLTTKLPTPRPKRVPYGSCVRSPAFTDVPSTIMTLRLIPVGLTASFERIAANSRGRAFWGRDA